MIVVLLVVICARIIVETSCDDGIVYNWTCYKIHRDPVNWFTAVNRCLANNGRMAVFSDQILKYFASSLLTNGSLWIGLIKSWWTWPDAGSLCLLITWEHEGRDNDRTVEGTWR